ncbi:hypothetical protein HQ487_00870 [Candidatus Uhrbacteria bacterium]|nr:hypothetical protein [Candidatus Uhrbacteria bacterium]
MLHLLMLIFLFIIQVSFIQVLPFPLDRIPFVLIFMIYTYQYKNQTDSWWWLICYGLILDILAISYAPFEVFSYALVSLVIMLLANRVFTNKSFYSVTATALIGLVTLSISQLMLMSVFNLTSSSDFLWQNVLYTNLWAGGFASLLLLFVFPFMQRRISLLEKFFLDRI